jgi:hypothetical protein
MQETIIIAIKYDEPEWFKTWDCLSKSGAPIIIADRNGVGSMSKAYNKSFSENYDQIKRYKYVWLVSNITFEKQMLNELENGMRVSGFSALHPSFKSDHKHMCPIGENIIREVSFIEFTAPIIKVEVFKKYPLDEDLPYVGHDLDWGFRVSEAGHKIGVHHGTEVKHTYIRFNNKPHPVTEMRKQMRKMWRTHTENKLVEKYGENWEDVLKYKNGL